MAASEKAHLLMTPPQVKTLDSRLHGNDIKVLLGLSYESINSG